MKRLSKHILSIMMVTVLLIGMLPFANAIENYESYLPTITRLESNPHGTYYYTVPFSGNTYKYGFFYGFDGTWWPQNWEEINQEQSMTIHFSGKISDGKYPIIAELISPDSESFKNPIIRKETGFYVDITVLPELPVADITFTKNSTPQNFDNEYVYSWTADLGTDYKAGIYVFHDITNTELNSIQFIDQDGDNLDFVAYNLPSDTYTVPKKNVILQYTHCTGVSPDGKTIYVEVSQAQHTIPTTPTQSSQTDATPTDSTATIIAKPTSAPVILDGKNVVFDAYEIADNNYFKIRDLASVLSGTDRQFEVSWDAANQSIQLTSGIPYTPVGNELTKGNGQNQNAKVSNAKITLNGASLTLMAYEINGNTYFKLRDLGEALGFVVDWDSAQNTILINTTSSK